MYIGGVKCLWEFELRKPRPSMKCSVKSTVTFNTRNMHMFV